VLLLEAGTDDPQFDHLPDEIKIGFDTGIGAPPWRTPAGYPITPIVAAAAGRAALLNLSLSGINS
jgi:hypothetical protein